MERILRSVRQAELTQHREFEPSFIVEDQEDYFEWDIHPLNIDVDEEHHEHPDIPFSGVPLLFPGTGDAEWGPLEEFPDDSVIRSRELMAAVEDQGLEALAWYRSFHFEPQEKWGIYLLDRGVYFLAKEYFSRYYDDPDDEDVIQECIQHAAELLYWHELWHFITEMAATTMEFNAFPNPSGLYVDYYEQRFHEPVKAVDMPTRLEEAMANEYARSKFCHGKDTPLKSAVADFMERQPDGYRHWENVKHHQSWKMGLHHLANLILGRKEGDENPTAEWAFDFPSSFNPEKSVPIYIVDTIPDDIHKLRASIWTNLPRKFSSRFKSDLRTAKRKHPRAWDDFDVSQRYIDEHGEPRSSRRPKKYHGAKYRGKISFYQYYVLGKKWRVLILDPKRINHYVIFDQKEKIKKRIRNLK